MFRKLAHNDKCDMVCNIKMYGDISIVKGFVMKFNVFPGIFEVILHFAFHFSMEKVQCKCGSFTQRT
jgi:hypothetical protein